MDPDECASFIDRPHLQLAFIYTFNGGKSTFLSCPSTQAGLHPRRPVLAARALAVYQTSELA
jgi:hypothetical protein